jgi:hypothetical protein
MKSKPKLDAALTLSAFEKLEARICCNCRWSVEVETEVEIGIGERQAK